MLQNIHCFQASDPGFCIFNGIPTCPSWYLNRRKNERLLSRLDCIFHMDFKRKRPWKVILQQTYCHNVSWWFNTEDSLNNDPPDRLNRYFYQSLDRSKNQYSHKVELESMSLHFIVLSWYSSFCNSWYLSTDPAGFIKKKNRPCWCWC